MPHAPPGAEELPAGHPFAGAIDALAAAVIGQVASLTGVTTLAATEIVVVA